MNAKAANVILLLGSAIFLIGAFSPPSWVFAEPDIAKRIEMTISSQGSWMIAQIFFGLGPIVTSIGLFLVWLNGGKTADGYAFTAFAASTVGAIFWAWHVYMRAIEPETFFLGQLQPRWLPAVYFILTNLALCLYGVSLLRSGHHRWMGWMNIAFFILFAIQLIVAKNIPPLNFYLIILITSIVLLVKSRSSGMVISNKAIKK